MHNVPQPQLLYIRIHNADTMHVMPLLVPTPWTGVSTTYSIGKWHRSNILSPGANNNRKRNGSEERNDIDRNTMTGMTTEDERTTTEIVTIATTPQIMIEGETTKGTWNDGSTQIRIDGT